MGDAQLSFSQAYGYEDIPGPLRLGELPREARTHIWNLFFQHIKDCKSTNVADWSRSVDSLGVMGSIDAGPWIGGDWKEILFAVHLQFHERPWDEWDTEFRRVCKELRHEIETKPFNKVFDLIQFVLRYSLCPPEFISDTKHTFAKCRLAYTIDFGPPPTILPAATPEEGGAVVDALGTLRQAGLDGSAAHLRKASERINAGDWAGSVRESIHAVESVARQLDPGAETTLGPALSALEKRGAVHPVLKDAFSKLYGYTSDEQGVRHALLDQTKAQVGQDEAVFMLGACASFASYLWRRHAAGASA